MSLYECVFIARPDLSTAQVEGLANQFSSVIQQAGGKVKKIEHCGLRTLAYRIRKNRRAYYVLMNIDAEASVLHEMERQMSLNEDIMRHLTVVVDKHEDGPSVLSYKRQEGTSESSFRGKDAAPKEGGYRRHASAEGNEFELQDDEPSLAESV